MDITSTDIKKPSGMPEIEQKITEDTTLSSETSETSDADAEQFRKIDALLHSEQEAKRLIGVMSLYGRIYYDWHLDTDLIDWRGPIQQLIRSLRGIVSGDIFLRRLNQQDFDQRMMLLEETCKTRRTFHATYHLNVTDNIYCQVEEYAEMLFTKAGKPIKMLGAIQVKPAALILKNDQPADYQSKEDILTRLQLIEKFDKDIQSSRENNTYGAFVAVTIDRLTDIGISHGKQGVDKVIQFVLQKIKGAIRQHDSIGILGGNSFGLILYNCDRWGIVSATERLLSTTQGQKVDMGGGSSIEVTISAGGAVFPCEDMNALMLLSEAEIALTDALNTKSAARFWKPSMDATLTPPPTTNTNREKGKRRMTDVSAEAPPPEEQESASSDKTTI